MWELRLRRAMTSEIHCDSLWHGADIVTMRDGNYHTLTDGAIAVRDGKIVWIGEHAALPPALSRTKR